MVKEIEVEPVTRLEGHGGLRIVIDDDGKVKDAQFNITSTRFFEKFCEAVIVSMFLVLLLESAGSVLYLIILPLRRL